MQNRSKEQFDSSMKGDPGRVVVVFTEVLKFSVQERAAFLERVCAGDENLRHTVEALLRAHDRLGNFLEEPAVAAIRVSSGKVARQASSPPNAQRRDRGKTKTSFQSRPRKRNGE